MFKDLLRDTKLLLLLLAVLLVKLFSMQPAWVERYYTYGLYPFVARMQRVVFGWLPFSFDDLLYTAAVLYLFYAAWRLLLLVRDKKLRQKLPSILYRVIKLAMWVYLAFNVLWGLNYNRQGVAAQLGLSGSPYRQEDVVLLTRVLQERLNDAAAKVDTAMRSHLQETDYLDRQSRQAFLSAEKNRGFLRFRLSSLKPSLFSPIAHFIGYTGYYNPFTGEAQLNTTIPAFLKPFVTCHEMAHQLGYGRENEANFVAFLALQHTRDPDFRYALYFDLYRYALRDLARFDTTAAKAARAQLHPLVLRDNETLKAYFLKTKNPVEPLSAAFYDRYLKLNSQAQGLRTYNEVVALLIAYQRKYGIESI